jgi:hypothetical protein
MNLTLEAGHNPYPRFRVPAKPAQHPVTPFWPWASEDPYAFCPAASEDPGCSCCTSRVGLARLLDALPCVYMRLTAITKLAKGYGKLGGIGAGLEGRIREDVRLIFLGSFDCAKIEDRTVDMLSLS